MEEQSEYGPVLMGKESLSPALPTCSRIPNKLAQDWKCQEALASVSLSGALYNKFKTYGMQLES